MMIQPRTFQSRPILFCLVLLGLVFAGLGQGCATEIDVSVDGSAQADGSLTKPYGFLPDALKAARVLRKSGYTEPLDASKMGRLDDYSSRISDQ